jgi:hypothetical protein
MTSMSNSRGNATPLKPVQSSLAKRSHQDFTIPKSPPLLPSFGFAHICRHITISPSLCEQCANGRLRKMTACAAINKGNERGRS